MNTLGDVYIVIFCFVDHLGEIRPEGEQIYELIYTAICSYNTVHFDTV